jgi:hypothetical protein
MARTLPNVPGIERLTQAERTELWEMAERNGWPRDALPALMSLESGFRANIRNPQPNQTATGLIQMIDSTAKGLGIEGGADELRTMNAAEQLPYVEKYFQRAFKHLSGAPRLADFYLANWGARPGLPLSHVLATKGDDTPVRSGSSITYGDHYRLNRGLDANGDGRITVADLDTKLRRTLQGRGRISADPPAMTPPVWLAFFLDFPFYLGDSGLLVRGLQHALNQHGARLALDEKLGPNTHAALVAARRGRNV